MNKEGYINDTIGLRIKELSSILLWVTMAAEAGVLGVPFIRHNGFVGRITYLEDLEKKYHLGYGVPPDEAARVPELLNDILDDGDRCARWSERRKRLLAEKIDVTQYFVDELSNACTIRK